MCNKNNSINKFLSDFSQFMFNETIRYILCISSFISHFFYFF
ncbi:hypothetical protein BAXH7_01939 [Bacillus amyloliquefaciens XH7]|nr:hypothetical protein BAXH7_01939 [Bacillus amyloliquefaciens XH7]